MKEIITFITGNSGKAAFATKYLGVEVQHRKLDLVEVQSNDVKKVVIHKAQEAFNQVGGLVLIEDTSLVFSALGKMPGPFIKWFFENHDEDPQVSMERLCRMLDGFSNRQAIAQVCYGLYDGKDLQTFFGEKNGTVPQHPRGHNGMGWDPIFTPKGSRLTWGEMDWENMTEEQLMKYSLRVPVYRNMEKVLQNG